MHLKRSIWIVAALCALLLAACGSGDDGGDTATEAASGGGGEATEVAEGKKVAFILPSLQNDFYLAQQAGAKETESKSPGPDVDIVAGTGEGSGADLIAKIEDALTKQADVIAIESGRAGREGRPLRHADPGLPGTDHVGRRR